MTEPMPMPPVPPSPPGRAGRRQPTSGLALLGWVVAAGVAFYVLFLVIAVILRHAPEPIGSRSALFVDGARMTLYLTVVSGLIGLLLGVLAGLGRTSNPPPLHWLPGQSFFQNLWNLVSGVILRVPRWLAGLYVWLIRGTPLLVQILFVYNALPPILQSVGLNVQLNEFWSAVVALSLNVGAYNAEVIRAGIQGVPKGQTEAARSLGLSGAQTMSTVVLPQALRLVVPPLVNNVVALLKDSSLASVIALVELTLAGQRVSSETFQPIPVLTTVAAVYLALTTVLTLFTDQLEKQVKVASR